MGTTNWTDFEGSESRGEKALLLGALLILFLTLFPFDFSTGASPDPAQPPGVDSFDLSLVQPDIVENILLFIPFGFGLAGFVTTRKGFWRSAGICMIAGAVVSVSVEISQFFLPARYPSLADILNNSFGSAAGFFVFRLWHHSRSRQKLQSMRRMRGPIAVVAGVAACSVIAAFLLKATSVWRKSSVPTDWDLTMPLYLGNDRGGDRQWHGTLSDFILADRAATADEIRDIALGADPHSTLGSSLLAHYSLKAPNGFVEQSGNLVALETRESAVRIETATGFKFDDGACLATTDSVETASARIEQSAQLTVSAFVATASLRQTGPARLFSISAGTDDRNLTIGQRDNELVVRIRMPMTGRKGSEPEFVFPRAFQDLERHHLAFTYDGVTARLFIDGLPSGRAIPMSPESNLFHLFNPPRFDFPLNPVSSSVSRVVYYGILFIPLGALLGSVIRRNAAPVVSCMICVACCGALELAVAGANGRPFGWITLALGILLTFITASPAFVSTKSSR